MNNMFDQLKKAKDRQLLDYIKQAKLIENSEKKRKFIADNIVNEFKKRPLPYRISTNAITELIEQNITIFDVIHNTENKKINNIVMDHNTPDLLVIYNLVYNNEKKYFDEQTLDIITKKEKNILDKNGFKNKGSKKERDSLCSEKVVITDLYGTDRTVIKQFWEQTKLDPKECYDPCAFDARWGCGFNSDILPMSNTVQFRDFFKINKMPEGAKYIVCNPPFGVFKQWVEHCMNLTEDFYLMCNADAALKYFNGHIKEFWAITGCDGNQKDWRSKCEFDIVGPSKKSTIWTCIAHFTKEKVPKFNIKNTMTKELRSSEKYVSIGQSSVIDRDDRVFQIHGNFERGLSKKEVFKKYSV